VPDPSFPFARVFVAYDGSEPAEAALAVGIAVARLGSQLVIGTIVNEVPIIARSASGIVALDPTPVMETLDAEAAKLLAAAGARARAAGLEPDLKTIHDLPVAGILAASESAACDLIVIGTHARGGVARTFLGSTAEGVLRSMRVPAIVVRAADRIAAMPFADVVVAVDDSDPGEAAVDLAARLATSARAHLVLCHAIELKHVYERAATYGFDPVRLGADMVTEGTALVRGALSRTHLPADTPIEVTDGDAEHVVLAAARAHRASLIVAGTHGRRGLRRLVLGSVAERIHRASDVPVMIVPVNR
jgi:nucleotide-binding universal stress UspA family protein